MKIMFKKKKSSHWTTDSMPILEATKQACGTEYNSKDIYLQFLKEILPFDTVADFGCGAATWLSSAKRCGVSSVKGYDIAEIDISDREIESHEFVETDLSKKIEVENKYDLVISTEVAEHIDETFSEVFIHNLCQAGDVILFSAAIPYQGGMSHINENWMEYWHQKFVANKFYCFDLFRPTFWNDPRVVWYYRQNCLLYVAAEKIPLLNEMGFNSINPLSMIHPEMYLKAIHREGYQRKSDLKNDIKHFYEYAYHKKVD